jgi:hypothetical protein
MGIGGALEGVAGAHIQNSSCPTVDIVTAADGTFKYALPHYVLFHDTVTVAGLKSVEQGNYHAFDLYAFPPDYFVFTDDYLAQFPDYAASNPFVIVRDTPVNMTPGDPCIYTDDVTWSLAEAPAATVTGYAENSYVVSPLSAMTHNTVFTISNLGALTSATLGAKKPTCALSTFEWETSTLTLVPGHITYARRRLATTAL